MNPEDKLQETLSELLNQLDNNQSIITNVAKSWSKVSFISKTSFNISIVLGLVFCAMFGPVGLFIGLAIAAAVYAGTTHLLTNHANNSYNERVKNRVLSLGKLITEVTEDLNTIKSDLSSEVSLLREENVSLKDNIQSLDNALVKNKKLSVMLKTMVDNLSGLAIEDGQSREKFQNNLNQFQESNQVYSSLLNRQESHLVKLGLFRNVPESKEQEESTVQLKLVKGS